MVKDYNISKVSGACTRCQKDLPPGDRFVAVVREVNEEFQRRDYCTNCWEGPEGQQLNRSPEVFGVWVSCIPQVQERKKLFVDDELLIDFFERLDGVTDQRKIAFRFVLALVLMRKKLLVYDCTEQTDNGTEQWLMHLKGSEHTHHVIDPKMDEEKIAEVSSQIGAILEGEL